MSASSGIAISHELIEAYAEANTNDTRFIIVSIREESLELDKLVPPQASTFQEDLNLLPGLLDDKMPSYVLVRLDDEERSWLFISYVPEIASVRNKMLYAASRSVLTKNLGDRKIKDSLFATTKTDLTPEAYLAHLRSSSAPKPMSAREIEAEAVKAAERSGVGRMKSHIGDTVGCIWSQEVIDAVSSLANPSLEMGNLVVIAVDIPTETLVLVEHRTTSLDEVPTVLPKNDPSYSFFAWDHAVGAPKRDILFIYACPSSSPIKSRMLYSSGVTGVVLEALKQHNITVTKRVETSDPADLDIAFIKSELELVTTSSRPLIVGDEKRPFSKPRGPARKR